MAEIRPILLKIETKKPILIICDHASNEVPNIINNGSLSLTIDQMHSHIAYDIGALGVAKNLSYFLNAPLISSTFSRLVIDPNRAVDDPTLIMQIYDRNIIEANKELSYNEIEKRKNNLYYPYHKAIKKKVDGFLNQGMHPIIVSIHSYTKKLLGKPTRPWHLGILWNKENENNKLFAEHLIKTLEIDKKICIGNNQPYSGGLRGDTLSRFIKTSTITSLIIEIRNDLIGKENEQHLWAKKIFSAIKVYTELDINSKKHRN